MGKDATSARGHDWLKAAILVVRDRVIEQWMASIRETYQNQNKRVYYLSMEFLIGRLLRDAASNLGLFDNLQAALEHLGVEADLVEALEPDAALGNGGLGRLAACFMESMASLGIPAFGYGIRYRHGLFRQKIIDGVQIELPEDWLVHGNPWEFERREREYEVGFGGTVEASAQLNGVAHYKWKPSEKILAVAFDTPICGWKGKRVNTLRLWNARACGSHQARTIQSGRPYWGSGRYHTGRKHYAGSCILRTPPRLARNCACARNISSPRHRCRIFSGAMSANMAAC